MPIPQQSRVVTDSDRLINVWGYGSPEHGEPQPEGFFDELCRITGGYNPGSVLVIGLEEDAAEFFDAYEKAGGDPKKLIRVPSKEEGGLERAFCFASEKNANIVVDAYHKRIKTAHINTEDPLPCDIKAVVEIFQDGHEEFLPHVLRRCPDIRVFCIQLNFPDEQTGKSPPAGMEPRTDLAGYEPIPSSVDLDAAVIQNSDDDVGLAAIPDAAIYGEALRKIIDQANGPRGYSCIAALVAASVFVEGTSNIRATLYGALVGGVHTGKTVTSDNVRALVGLPDASPLCVRTPYSDRGLFQVCKGDGTRKRLLPIDEGRVMMAKGNIQNATLISLLCSLWSRNIEGGADKRGLETINVELSILMNLKVKDASEFPEIFTHATSHGLYDRFLFGVRGDEKWHHTPWDFDATRDVITLSITKPHVSGEIFDTAQNWSAAGKDRDRLKEIALRVAYITSAMNNELEVSLEAMNAALCLMEWQESIRQMFQPAEGSDEYEEFYNVVEAVFLRKRKVTQPTGVS